jgi:RNA recognition motif-containing protein
MQRFENERAAEYVFRGEDSPWRIWVGGLPKNANEKQLAAYFSMFGALTECQIIVDNGTGQSRGFAYVSFQEKGSFDKVISLKEHNYNKSKLNIAAYQNKEATDRRSAEENERKIFVVNMHYKTKKSTVEEHFSKFGPIERIDLKTHHGIGFITFKDRLSAIRCFQSEEAQNLDGRNIECRPVLSKGELKDQYNINRDRLNAKKIQALKLSESRSNSDRRQRSENSSELETRPRNQVQLSTLLANFQMPAKYVAQGGEAYSRHTEKTLYSGDSKNDGLANRGSEGARSGPSQTKKGSRFSEGKDVSHTDNSSKANEDILKSLGFLDDEEEEEEVGEIMEKKLPTDYMSTQASGIPNGFERSTLKYHGQQPTKKLSLSDRFNSARIARSYFDPSQIDSQYDHDDTKLVKSDIVEGGKPVRSFVLSNISGSGPLEAIPEECKKYESTFLELPK